MAEAQSEPVPSSSGEAPVVAEEALQPPVEPEAAAEPAVEPPAAKKPRLASPERLEQRLGGILCCAVCLDLPPAAVYQCTNGHLMCAACFTHVLADARLRDEAATCPNCRVDISKTNACRNLAVEKTVSELPQECKFCAQVFPRHALKYHEQHTCDERLTECEYAVVGCPWRGPYHESLAHATSCPAPSRSAADALLSLRQREQAAHAKLTVYTQLLDLLSYEKITFNDLQLKPYRTEEFVHKLYYETSRFAAFGSQWVVKANVNRHQRDPTQSIQREITYQLILKSKVGSGTGSGSEGSLPLQWWCLRGPHGEAPLAPTLCSHNFTDDSPDTPFLPFPLQSPDDANRLLANKAIHFRLIMFLSSK